MKSRESIKMNPKMNPEYRIVKRKAYLQQAILALIHRYGPEHSTYISEVAKYYHMHIVD